MRSILSRIEAITQTDIVELKRLPDALRSQDYSLAYGYMAEVIHHLEWEMQNPSKDQRVTYDQLNEAREIDYDLKLGLGRFGYAPLPN